MVLLGRFLVVCFSLLHQCLHSVNSNLCCFFVYCTKAEIPLFVRFICLLFVYSSNSQVSLSVISHVCFCFVHLPLVHCCFLFVLVFMQSKPFIISGQTSHLSSFTKPNIFMRIISFTSFIFILLPNPEWKSFATLLAPPTSARHATSRSFIASLQTTYLMQMRTVQTWTFASGRGGTRRTGVADFVFIFFFFSFLSSLFFKRECVVFSFFWVVL